jgi:hypothetical protein
MRRVVSLAAAVALAAVAREAEDPRLRLPRRDAALLRSELALASSEQFYLRLDAGASRLSLRLKGVTLSEYPVAELIRGVPQVLFFERRPRGDWDLRAFSGGRLSPERERDRLEVIAPAPAAGASPPPPPIPKTAEETYSVPSSYRISFEEGLSVEVETPGLGRNRTPLQRIGDRLSLALSDRAAALGRGADTRVRLRVALSPEDAASLYRSLPPNVSLIVVGLP